jgi:RNA-directed DNA polymerase
VRIAKAIREGKRGKAKALQWLLTHSHHAKLLAVRRVTQNKGSKTPGVDGVIWDSNKKKSDAVKTLKRRGYKPQPLRRIYIPKKKGKRPLGIPCLIDRAQQALHLLGLEPISETLADKNSYGFRPRRSVADAIEQCFVATSRKHSPQWLLEGDIKSCFDRISHEWLVENIPMDTAILKSWLSSGFIEKSVFYRTDAGTPQGGVISPTLMLLTLRGLEDAVKQARPKTQNKVNYISYADDFVITATSKEMLENTVKPIVKAFLQERGLELSEEKTKITHIDDGFDFLGFNIRKYNGKLITKPARQNVLEFVRNVRGVIKKYAAVSAGELIRILNPKIQGWANFYRHKVSSKTFCYVDHQIHEALCRWAKRRHPNKPTRWIYQKYFCTVGMDNWVFYGQTTVGGSSFDVHLVKMIRTKITRHIKIRSDANPYDPAYDEYFIERRRKKVEQKTDKQSRNHWFDTPPPAL